MEISRRHFLHLAAAEGPGTALAGLVGMGPYCSVGCATLVHTVEGKIVNIEGDPRSPHSDSVGALHAMAREILDEYRLTARIPAFDAWLAAGAPSEDRSP